MLLKRNKIALSDGTSKSIEKLTVGEIVFGIDKNNKVVPSQITKTFTHVDHFEYLIIKTEDKNKIKVTKNHPIYNGNEFVEAGTLQAGDYISILDKKTNTIKQSRIVKIKEKPLAKKVYNIEVAEIHNYIAGGVIVHNKNTYDVTKTPISIRN